MEPNVLILDNDLGFVMWLGRALNDAGIRALPSSTCVEASAIVRKLRPARVNLLIANLALEGSREVVEKLAAKNESLKIIAIGGRTSRRVIGRISRPRGKTLPSPGRYVQAVLRALG